MNAWTRFLTGLAVGAAALLGVTGATGALAADALPKGPIRWIVPYPAGGGSDLIARTLAGVMQQQTGRVLIVENRPGAGTSIGMSALLGAPADGTTIGSADVGTLAFNPFLYAKLPYDPNTSFSYVGGLVRTAFVLVTRPGLAVNSLDDLLALARKDPGKLSYASAGPGSPHHVAMEMLQQRANVSLFHVPYKGGGPALQDLMSGQVDAMMLDLPGLLANKDGGRFKMLGAALPARHPLLPQVPTLKEAGLDGVVAYSWQVLLVRADTPRPMVDGYAAELRKALQEPAVRDKLAVIGAEPMPLSMASTVELIKSETSKWGPVIKAARIHLD